MLAKCCSNHPGMLSACETGGLNQVSNTNPSLLGIPKCEICRPSYESSGSPSKSAVSGAPMLHENPLPTGSPRPAPLRSSR